MSVVFVCCYFWAKKIKLTFTFFFRCSIHFSQKINKYFLIEIKRKKGKPNKTNTHFVCTFYLNSFFLFFVKISKEIKKKIKLLKMKWKKLVKQERKRGVYFLLTLWNFLENFKRHLKIKKIICFKIRKFETISFFLSLLLLLF